MRTREIFLDEATHLINMAQKWAALNQSCLRKSVGVVVANALSNGGLNQLLRAKNGPSAPGHKCSNIVGGCGCSHAEPRAILDLMRQNIDRQRLFLLCNYSPCTNCANIINDSKLIDVVIFGTMTQHDTRGAELLKKAGLKVYSTEEVYQGQADADISEWFKAD